jgi:hypothetical protein
MTLRWTFLLAAVSVLLLALAPSADVVAFGLHEHVTTERSFGLTGAETAQGATPSHHCELSVSLGELIPVVELPTPLVLIGDPPNPRASSPQHRPFVPLTPPRS